MSPLAGYLGLVWPGPLVCASGIKIFSISGGHPAMLDITELPSCRAGSNCAISIDICYWFQRNFCWQHKQMPNTGGEGGGKDAVAWGFKVQTVWRLPAHDFDPPPTHSPPASSGHHPQWPWTRPRTHVWPKVPHSWR